MRNRQPLDHIGERQHANPERLHHRGKRLPDLARQRLDIGPEERLPDDGQRQTRHFFRRVDPGAVGPPGRRACRAIGHHRRVRRDPVLVKCRLRQAPLSEVRLPLARQQPVAEHRLDGLDPTALLELPLVRHEDVAHVPGLRHDVQMLGAGHEVHQRAVLLDEPGEELQRIPARPIHQARQEGRRPWRVDGRLVAVGGRHDACQDDTTPAGRSARIAPARPRLTPVVSMSMLDVYTSCRRQTICRVHWSSS